ncbi:NAD-dependent epimerase/dehydratase family protein [Cyclobacteriaceae bacterium]|nr:NAD-dependent epimerase/dehydratase family protein [Cyclobacteriaceae bacterium]
MVFSEYQRSVSIKISEDVVVHLAGKAHDLKKVSLPNDYYGSNTKLTGEVFDAFLASKAKKNFITLSTVKPVADEVNDVLQKNLFQTLRLITGRVSY